MKKILTLLCLLCIVTMGARADEYFRYHRYDTFKVAPITSSSIVFVGNSITDMHLWAEAFGNDSRIVNRGNSGARSNEILANVRSYCVGQPAKIFLMIGINDLHDGTSYSTVVSNIQQTIATIKEVSPSTKIYVQSVLPSTYASIYSIQNCNNALQTMLTTNGYDDVTYINLYDLLYGKVNSDTSGRYSFDALHLTAAGYQIWTKEMEKYITDKTSVYPEQALSLQNNGGLSSSFGARATYFSLLPITADDVLFFGDEMVKNGEWNELLRNYNVKNRGTNWGYEKADASIATTSKGVDATFATVSGVVKDCPKQVLLYTGTGEVNNSSYNMNTAVSNYKTLVQKIRNCTSPTTKISLVSLMPTKDYSNSRVKQFNEALATYAAADDYLEYIDIYSTLATSGDNVKPDYFPATTYTYGNNNYLYGDGYVAVANVLAAHIDGCNPVTPAQAAAYRALIDKTGDDGGQQDATTSIVAGQNYTIQPYGTDLYVVPAASWSNRGGNMTRFSTEAPTVENGAVWTFASMNGGFAIRPAGNNYTVAYLNPWNAGSVNSNALGVWDSEGDDQTWLATAVAGMEHVYTLNSKGKYGAYMYYNPNADELYFNKPGTPTAANYFLIKPFEGDVNPDPDPDPDPVAEDVLWTGNINHTEMPWMRIPSIVKTETGDLLAFADYRYNHDDIGRNNSLNNGRIDIQMRRSTDNGENWSEAVTVAQGSGKYGATDAGYGDAAVVADNGGSGKVLLLAAAGSVSYGSSTRANPIRMAKFTSDNNGESWSAATDITSIFYGLLPSGVRAAFSTSGRIEQSVLRKEGAGYNRIYNPLCTSSGNYVLYSDDFGETWALLGGTCAQTGGDEAHVVELPNGDLLLVSRQASGDGRYINLFTYAKDPQGMADFTRGGTWNTNGLRNGTSASRCNGDIDLVTACPVGSNTPMQLLIQTAPYYSSPRRQVSYHYKELPTPDASGNYFIYDFTNDWILGLQVSDKASAYSSIVSIDHATEGILFEESEKNVSGTNDPYAYNIVFRKHTIGQITNGAYEDAEPGNPPVTIHQHKFDAADSRLYDLQGRRVSSQGQRRDSGVYISDRKKVIE